MTTIRRFLGFALLVTALVSLSATTSVGGEEFDAEKAIANAKTAADHEAIAAYFEKEAAEAEAKAEKHAKMRASYKKRGGAAVEKAHLDVHCRALVKSYAKAAAEANALAASHRAMAK